MLSHPPWTPPPPPSRLQNQQMASHVVDSVLAHLEQQGTYARLLFFAKYSSAFDRSTRMSNLGKQHICLWITDSLRVERVSSLTEEPTWTFMSEQCTQRPNSDCSSLVRSFYRCSIETGLFCRKCANLLCTIFYKHFIHFFFFAAYFWLDECMLSTV